MREITFAKGNEQHDRDQSRVQRCFAALSGIVSGGGLSDMIDGAAAGRTGTVSGFGSKPDTFADIVFAAVCRIKPLPVPDVPVRLSVWFAATAVIKLCIRP